MIMLSVIPVPPSGEMPNMLSMKFIPILLFQMSKVLAGITKDFEGTFLRVPSQMKKFIHYVEAK